MVQPVAYGSCVQALGDISSLTKLLGKQAAAAEAAAQTAQSSCDAAKSDAQAATQQAAKAVQHRDKLQQEVDTLTQVCVYKKHGRAVKSLSRSVLWYSTT